MSPIDRYIFIELFLGKNFDTGGIHLTWHIMSCYGLAQRKSVPNVEIMT
jgi:hypothetical protein